MLLENRSKTGFYCFIMRECLGGDSRMAVMTWAEHPCICCVSRPHSFTEIAIKKITRSHRVMKKPTRATNTEIEKSSSTVGRLLLYSILTLLPSCPHLLSVLFFAFHWCIATLHTIHIRTGGQQETLYNDMINLLLQSHSHLDSMHHPTLNTSWKEWVLHGLICLSLWLVLIVVIFRRETSFFLSLFLSHPLQMLTDISMTICAVNE